MIGSSKCNWGHPCSYCRSKGEMCLYIVHASDVHKIPKGEVKTRKRAISVCWDYQTRKVPYGQGLACSHYEAVTSRRIMAGPLPAKITTIKSARCERGRPCSQAGYWHPVNKRIYNQMIENNQLRYWVTSQKLLKIEEENELLYTPSKKKMRPLIVTIPIRL